MVFSSPDVIFLLCHMRELQHKRMPYWRSIWYTYLPQVASAQNLCDHGSIEGDSPASFPCMSWNVPIFSPNCFRSCVYSSAWSNAACMILSPWRQSFLTRLRLANAAAYPRGPPLSTSLSRSRPDMSTFAPFPTSPSTFSSGISTLSKNSSAVGEPLILEYQVSVVPPRRNLGERATHAEFV